MAIKPITDKQLVDAGNVNRETQTSQRNMNTRGGGNESQTIIPGIDLSKQYSITLKDIDTALMSHVKNIMAIRIKEANETIKVPVLYGNEERWKAVRKRCVGDLANVERVGPKPGGHAWPPRPPLTLSHFLPTRPAR